MHGTPLKDREEVKTRWDDFFNDMLNRRPLPQRRLHRIRPIGAPGTFGRFSTRLEVVNGSQEQQGPWD